MVARLKARHRRPNKLLDIIKGFPNRASCTTMSSRVRLNFACAPSSLACVSLVFVLVIAFVGQFRASHAHEPLQRLLPTDSITTANVARMLAGRSGSGGWDDKEMALVLPHDTSPGFSIKRFKTLPLSSNASSSHLATPQRAYHMLAGDYSRYFTVLEDGVVMTTSDISPLVNHPVHLVVVEETPNATNTHNLQLYVMHRNDMLRFPGSMLDASGEVRENRPSSTRVRGVPLMQAFSGGVVADNEKPTPPRKVRYTIIDGNTAEAFALQSRKPHAAKNTTIHANSLLIDGDDESGVWLVTNRPLDREDKAHYDLSIQASDLDGLDKTVSKIQVSVLDENDNRPVFKSNDYKFAIAAQKAPQLESNASAVTWKRFTILGKVEATDADGDKIAYSLHAPSNVIIIVPQTGEIMLVGEPNSSELLVEVEAHDLRYPSLKSVKPAKVLLEFLAPEPVSFIMQHMEHDAVNEHSHHREKRRVTRAVRPTKRIEFTEADGDTEGKSVFQLEKETDKETFKIRDDNPWVTVETNGAVRVKKKWDYEELGPEKTIDFWVIITNSGHNGKSTKLYNTFFEYFELRKISLKIVSNQVTVLRTPKSIHPQVSKVTGIKTISFLSQMKLGESQI